MRRKYSEYDINCIQIVKKPTIKPIDSWLYDEKYGYYVADWFQYKWLNYIRKSAGYRDYVLKDDRYLPYNTRIRVYNVDIMETRRFVDMYATPKYGNLQEFLNWSKTYKLLSLTMYFMSGMYYPTDGDTIEDETAAITVGEFGLYEIIDRKDLIKHLEESAKTIYQYIDSKRVENNDEPVRGRTHHYECSPSDMPSYVLTFPMDLKLNSSYPSIHDWIFHKIAENEKYQSPKPQ